VRWLSKRVQQSVSASTVFPVYILHISVNEFMKVSVVPLWAQSRLSQVNDFLTALSRHACSYFSLSPSVSLSTSAIIIMSFGFGVGDIITVIKLHLP